MHAAFRLAGAILVAAGLNGLRRASCGDTDTRADDCRNL
jgi:hypothetical protein